VEIIFSSLPLGREEKIKILGSVETRILKKSTPLRVRIFSEIFFLTSRRMLEKIFQKFFKCFETFEEFCRAIGPADTIKKYFLHQPQLV